MDYGAAPNLNNTQLCDSSKVSGVKHALAGFNEQPCQNSDLPFSFSINKEDDGRWHFEAFDVE